MTGIFRSNNPLSTTILFVYGILLKLPWLAHASAIRVQRSDGFLYSAIVKFLSGPFEVYPVLRIGVIYVLLFTQALMLNRYASKGKLFARPNYLVAMSYLLITSFFEQWNRFSATLLVTSLLIWVCGQLIDLKTNQHIKATLFNIGFVIGICSFIYLPSLALIVLVLLAVVISRPPRITEWLIMLLGMFALWYLLFSYLFMTDKLAGFRFPEFSFDLPLLQWNIQMFVGIGLLVFMTLLGSFFVQMESSKNVIQVRKRWMIFFISIILLVMLPLLGKNESLADWIVSVPGFALFVASPFFYIRSKWIRFILHWGMVSFVLYHEYL